MSHKEDHPQNPLSMNSEASVAHYEEKLKPKLESIVNSEAALPELVNTAEKIVNEALAPDPKNIITYKGEKIPVSVQLDKVIIAMLASAEKCGGERGKRYVAAAICSCNDSESDVVGALVALGITWLTHLLFVFKTGAPSRREYEVPSDSDSDTATRTSDELKSAQDPEDVLRLRKRLFTSEVIKRDGYECVLTGYPDFERHPRPISGVQKTFLRVANILPRGLGKFNRDQHSDPWYKCAATTFDILSNFARLPARTLEDLRVNLLDDPSNGLSLELLSHCAFDMYHWCLKETETNNVYDLKIFRNDLLCKKPSNNRITFTDRSGDFLDLSDSPPPTDEKSDTPSSSIRLPDPALVATHAAIAEIMDVSGADQFFDGVMRDYADGKLANVWCWSDMERLIEKQLLSDSIYQMFKSGPSGVWLGKG